MSYDAVLVVSFGGPEGPVDVMPFLESVTRGRNVPRERLLAVRAHYDLFGGHSPINEQNRALLAALREELVAHNHGLPVFWGNRHAAPFLRDAIAEMRDRGVKRALAFVTSAYGSYAGCRAYLEDIERARAAVGEGAPELHVLRKFYDHPLFIDVLVERVADAQAHLGAGAADARLVLTAHSIPLAMAQASPYVQQLRETGRLLAERLGVAEWDLVWQSRSGPPEVPWLEPDILDHLRALHETGVRNVIVLPVGFVSDHMEVVYDLDVEARKLARTLGIRFQRAMTPGVHPKFIEMIRELVEERLTPGAPRRSLGVLGLAPDTCAPDCCPGRVAPSRPPTT